MSRAFVPLKSERYQGNLDNVDKGSIPSPAGSGPPSSAAGPWSEGWGGDSPPPSLQGKHHFAKFRTSGIQFFLNGKFYF